jgi:hypothetical protein
MARVLALALAVFVLQALPAGAVIDGDADHVLLRKDCTGIDNCFETSDAVSDWLWDGGRNDPPSAGDEVIVDVGVGEFDPLVCPDKNPDSGWVTFRGAGRDRSIFVLSEGYHAAAITAVNCWKLGFQDLGTRSDAHGALWAGDGESTWTNVDMVGEVMGWYDFACAGSGSAPSGKHWVFGSRIWGNQGGWYGDCGAAWIYGSEITATPKAASVAAVGVHVTHRADARVYGSNVRVSPDASLAANTSGISLTGVLVGNSTNGITTEAKGTFHMHGGVIAVNAAQLEAADATGVETDDGQAPNAMAHVLDTSFLVQRGTSSGTSTRASGDGVMSSFVWQNGTAPPVSNLVSENGADMYVETDCQSGGTCNSGTETHLMIYRAACGASNPWFNVVTGACRVP